MRAAVIYTSFAPFHHARLQVAGAVGRARQHSLVGIEVASTQPEYRWPCSDAQADQYTRVTLFRGQDAGELPASAIYRRLIRCLAAARPDVVVVPGWGLPVSLYALTWCLAHQVPRVIIADSQPIDRPQTGLRVLTKRCVVRCCQAAFVGGAPHVRYLRALGMPAERCFVGCDVVDTEWFARESRPAVARRAVPNDRGRLLSCVRLLRRKNVAGVLEALVDHPHWTWTIAGDGPQRACIEARIQALELAGRVRLLGHVDYDALPRLYGEADVYLQPSLSEPWGLAVNEAMACSLPVLVSTRCGSYEDLVQDGVNGYGFEPARRGELGQVLDRMWAARSRWPQMGKASREAVGRWGLERFAESLWAASKAALVSRRSPWR